MSIIQRIRDWWKRRTSPIPCSEVFHSLRTQRNVLDLNDCSNKAGRYLEALIQEGYDAKIVVVKTPRNEMHAVVRCEGKYYDPTYGLVTTRLQRIGRYRFSVRFEDLSAWGGEFA
jgi:hypothetical protein